MHPFRHNLLARRLLLGVTLSLVAACGVLFWVLNRNLDDAHLEAITDMLAAREVGELVYVLSRKDCAQFPGACEQADALGPLTARGDLKRVFAPLYAPHIATASARRIAAAFDSAVGRQANRAQREQALKKRDFWKSLTPAQRDAIDALLASPEGVAYTEARRKVGQQLFTAYSDLQIDAQTRMLSVPLQAIAQYTKQYQDDVGATPPPPLVLAPIANRYYARRAQIMAAGASRLTLAFWTFKRAGGELLGEAHGDAVLASAANAARAAAALQALKPDFERYLKEREATYRARFAALAALERASTGAGGTPDIGEYERRLEHDLAGLEADRLWFRLAERVYVGARDHPYLMDWGVARPAGVDRALEQRFVQDRAALDAMNSASKNQIVARDAMRETLIAGNLRQLIDKAAPDAPPE